jgi:tungstate transport system substrate-binding protein
MDRRSYLGLLAISGTASIAGCAGTQTADTDTATTDNQLTISTATTVHDSGLLSELMSGLEQTIEGNIRSVVRGTGATLRTARDGDADLVIVHARPLEDEFLRNGYGINRRTVMMNDFLLVGPPEDPAGVGGQDPVAAFNSITQTQASFLSPGDRSETHIRERQLWEAAGVEPDGEWYRESGQGMGATLIAANQTGAYTLSDRGTFLTVRDDDQLTTHVVGGLKNPPSLLRNEYAVIPTNPTHHDVAYTRAMAAVGYLTGPGQTRINNFRADGEQAFRPVGLSKDPNFGQYVLRE